MAVAALGIQHLWTGDLSKLGTVSFVDGKCKKTLLTYRANGNKSLEGVLTTVLKMSREK